MVHNPKFTNDINSLGSEVYQKTGISVKLVMLKKLPEGMTMFDYESSLLATMKEPTIVITFSELDSQVDIEANDKSLYKYFDKQQVLSPVTSYVQAFIMATSYAQSWDEFKSMMTHVDGTILPLLGQKSKKGQVIDKYSVAMFNGYLDVAQQVCKSKGVILDNDMSNSANQTTLFYVKLLFYVVVLYAIIMYIKRIIYRRKHKDEVYAKW